MPDNVKTIKQGGRFQIMNRYDHTEQTDTYRLLGPVPAVDDYYIAEVLNRRRIERASGRVLFDKKPDGVCLVFFRADQPVRPVKVEALND